jgi:hypothetical protein
MFVQFLNENENINMLICVQGDSGGPLQCNLKVG